MNPIGVVTVFWAATVLLVAATVAVMAALDVWGGPAPIEEPDAPTLPIRVARGHR